MHRVCDTCGNKQGPFARYWVGPKLTGKFVFTCPIPLKNAEGKPYSDNERKAFAAACNNRRDKRFASA